MKSKFPSYLTISLTPIYTYFVILIIIDRELAVKILIGSITMIGLLCSLCYSASRAHEIEKTFKTNFLYCANRFLMSTTYAMVALIINYVWVAKLISNEIWYQRPLSAFFSVVIGSMYGKGLADFHFGFKKLISTFEEVN